MKEFKPYDGREYDRLLKEKFEGRELTQEEEEYCRYCYHYEEAQAGLL